MELSKQQQEIVYTDKKNVTVVAAAGSGKTRVLTERLKYILSQGYNPSTIVAITFTNAAAEEMRERVGPEASQCFIGTIHSYANFILSRYGINTRKLLDEEKFDELFDLVRKNPNCVLAVDYLLLDEAQDSTKEQFSFIFDYIKPKDYFIVFDHRQSIYEWAGADSDYVYDLSKREGVNCFKLTENYRNAPQILDFAREFLDRFGYKYFDDSKAMSKEYGKIYRVQYSKEKIGRYILDSGEPFKDWFVLCRTNDLIAEIQDTLTAMGIPCDTFKKGDLTNNELKDKMVSNTVKVLTIHTAKGLEANNVVVVGAKYFDNEQYRINYVAATRAKKLLIWCLAPKTQKPKKKKYESWD